MLRQFWKLFYLSLLALFEPQNCINLQGNKHLSFIFIRIMGFLKKTFYLLFWPLHVTCRIVVPQPGMEPGPPAVEVWRPSYQTRRQVLREINMSCQHVVLRRWKVQLQFQVLVFFQLFTNKFLVYFTILKFMSW